MVATSIIQKVDNDRLQKGVAGLTAGAYAITLTSQSESEIRGFVANGDGKEYGVVISEGHAFCSCPDAMYRKALCKHSVVLALHTIRTPKAEAKTETAAPPKPFNLKLAKVRRGA